MTVPRRQFLQFAATAASLPAFACVARAEDYPSRPVRMVVGFYAGSGPDILARLIGQWLSDRLGQQFIIDNRPGAAGNIGTEAVSHATPDGYTLLMITPANAINTSLYSNLNFSFIDDIAPVAALVRLPLIVEINPAVPAMTLPEFIAYAKANPGKINMASPGNGSIGHVAGELFKAMAGVDLVHVPYRADPLPDLLGGQVQTMFRTVVGSIEYFRAGKLRPLAVTTTTRTPELPDVPAVSEFVPGYEATVWDGIGAPKNTPAGIVDTLNVHINAALFDPAMKARLASLGYTTTGGSAADFGKFLAEETRKWAKVVKLSGAKAD
jgi:tripartite-type tricarboxylate transporter receptor subunit TctC